jgi:hypothetical protein
MPIVARLSSCNLQSGDKGAADDEPDKAADDFSKVGNDSSLRPLFRLNRCTCSNNHRGFWNSNMRSIRKSLSA